MSKSILSSLSIAAIACGAMLALLTLELSPASAFTLYGTSAQALTSGQFDRVYYRGGYRGGIRTYRGGVRYGGYRGGYAYRGGYGYRYGYRGGYGYRYGYGYHPYGYGYYPGYGYGAAALGAAAVAAHHCWINSYGTRVCNYY
jgi:hypothetical protein